MGGTGAFQRVAEASNRWRKYPTNFLYSGDFGSSLAVSRGSYGIYWSSTSYKANYSDGLSLNSSYVHPGTTNSSKYDGLSARCVLGS